MAKFYLSLLGCITECGNGIPMEHCRRATEAEQAFPAATLPAPKGGQLGT